MEPPDQPCKRGHPPNWMIDGAGDRRCRTCRCEASARSKARPVRAAAPPPPPPDDVEILSEDPPLSKFTGHDPNADTHESPPISPDQENSLGQESQPLSDTLTDIQGRATSVSDRAQAGGTDQNRKQPGVDAGGKTARLAEVEHPPRGGLPVSALIEHRIKRYAAKEAHERARALISVRMPDDLPIGILHFGDPHLDDDGVDLALVRSHVELVQRTPGLYAANVGDSTNNWIGRLAALYGSQATTEAEAWQLCEWFVREVGPKWLYILGGNHDVWSGAGDPLQWITRSAGALYQPTEARLELQFPGGRRVRINARHDFPGRSIYNDAHGPMRWLIFNQRDHLAVGGHIHVSAHATLKAADSGITMHALRVASYKRHDEYARTGGFPDKHLSPCAVTTIDPRLPDTHPDLIHVFWDPAEGARYLAHLRAQP